MHVPRDQNDRDERADQSRQAERDLRRKSEDTIRAMHQVLVETANRFDGKRLEALRRENPSIPAKGMVAYITAAYPGAWQVGDSKRLWLCDATADLSVRLPCQHCIDQFALQSRIVAAGDAHDAIVAN